MKKLTYIFVAFLFTAGTAFAQSNNASTTQTGDNNATAVTQTGDNNSTIATQNGDDNSAIITQGIQGIATNNDEATVAQVGDNNSAELMSRDGFPGSPDKIEYDVTQTGNSNFVSARAFNGPSDAGIDQIGDENEASLTQGAGASDMSVTLEQAGNNNSAKMFQGTDNAVLQATFNGDDNFMDVSQEGGGAWQKLNLDVTGSSNMITGTQGGHDADQFTEINGSNNTFDFYQDKSSDAGISVTGDFNNISLNQNGVGNSVFATVPWEKNGIVVDGNTNSINVTQTSDFNTATVNVTGSGNTSTITQN